MPGKKNIKFRLKNYITAKILNLLSKYELEKINILRRNTNVFIHENFSIGIDSLFEIKGVCNKIEINSNVLARSFCNFWVNASATLVINDNVFFNNYCSINCLGHIEIGKNTMFGEGVKLYDHNHKYSYDAQGVLNVERDDFKIGKIKIGENCWIGSNVTILNNVEIGDNVIIGANNLIYKSIPSNAIIKLKTEQF